jgi:drug/metabolite transporter (DMT)-like permease
MVRLLSVLVFGLFLEAVGVVLLSQGLKEQGELQKFAFDELLRFVQRALTNRHLLAGVALEAGFFGCLLFLMSHGDVSFVWPLTSLGFVLTTFAARFILHEPVSPLRWFGVFLIVLGAGTIIYTEKLREKEKAAAQTVTLPSRT